MATQTVEIVVPDGLCPGDTFDVEWGAVNYNIAVPDGCFGGTALNALTFDAGLRWTASRILKALRQYDPGADERRGGICICENEHCYARDFLHCKPVKLSYLCLV